MSCDIPNTNDCSRRDFIKGGVLAATVPAVGVGAFYAGWQGTHFHPVRVGVVGTGDEGQVLLGAINPKYIEVKSIADIRPYNQHRAFYGDVYSDVAEAARPGLLAKYGRKTEAEA
ncbi:MAG: hypothetical protein FWE67_14290, partial [Planctomycetaceae bacterium]|nr:hypothetical protein [Planctomycetaceae bacterium]